MKATGLFDMVKSREVTDVSQVWMNEAQNDLLLECMKKNLRKDRKFKMYTNKYIDNSAAMDWLNYSPVSDSEVPEFELWVYAPGEVKATMEARRAKKRQDNPAT